MATAYEYTVYRGTFIHLPRLPESCTPVQLELLRHRGALWVSAVDGRIKGVDWQASNDAGFAELMKRNGWIDVDIPSEAVGPDDDNSRVRVKIVRAREARNEFFFPGFIDTHIHAPQFPNVGLFGSSTLLDWLETYTFPVESGFGAQSDQDVSTAKVSQKAPHSAIRIYNQVISRTLSHGTTCASYFATIHIPATNALATLCHSRGQRAFIGRVCMDDPDFCPSYYRDVSAEETIIATRSTIEHIHTLDPDGTLIRPIITPRFAPTCSRLALVGLAKLAAEYTPPLHIQTHISENTNEVALVNKLFPEADSYAAVYDTYNLLTPRTILAHAVHLSEEERALIRKRQAKISHCPASNSALGSGICPVRTLLDEGLTVGLGTDVSGGYSPSILEAARQTCLVSRLLGHTAAFADGTHKHHPAERHGHPETPGIGREKISVAESLYLATRGGAAVVDMADEIGGFDLGMFWDAQMIELGAVEDSLGSGLGGPVGNVDLFGPETWEEKIQKWVWSGDDRNVKAVWVGGRLVHSRP